MKSLVLFLMLGVLFIATSCDDEKKPEEVETNDLTGFASFGDTISPESAISSEELYEKYKNLKEGDTVDVKFTGKIEKVCQTKGCWMTIALPEDEVSNIRFKDYGFFMPLNAAESEAIVNGKAFLAITSVETLKERAMENEMEEDEIAAIDEPSIQFAFEADGVLIKEE